MNNNTIPKVLLLSLGLCIVAMAQAGDFPPWDVPADAQKVANPNPKNKDNIEAGRKIFTMQCKACHGETGNGQGAVKAANFTTAEFQAQSDGAIHYKLVTGRATMPSFKAMPEADSWNVIHYLRSFGENAIRIVRKNAEVMLRTEEKGDRKFLIAAVSAKSTTGNLPAAGVPVGFFVKRRFGDLPIGKPHITNEKGYAQIEFTGPVPGDSLSNLTLIARVDDAAFNPAEASLVAKWGTPPPPDTWDTNRELFKTNAHVPIWLLLTFFGILSGVAAGVGYVALLVWKIKKAG